MSFFTRTKLWALLLVFLALGIFGLGGNANAATQEQYKRWQACVKEVYGTANDGSCDIKNSSDKFTYGGADATKIASAEYKISSAKTSDGSSRFIDLIDPADTTKTFFSSIDAIGAYRFVHINNEKMTVTSGEEKLTFYIYHPAGGTLTNKTVVNPADYSLITMGSGTETKIVALVSEATQSKVISFVNTNYVYAQKIDKQAGTTSSTGGFVSPQVGTDGEDATAKSCEELGGTLSWVMCPVIGSIGDALDWMNSTVADLLEFNTSTDFGQNLSDNDSSVQKDPIKDVWGIVKNITSLLMVLIALVMVISQAIGTGPFDAYTIRKVLPRFVVAVIFIQLSWVIFSWFIDVSNQLGRDIASLIYYPFGGPSELSLESVLAKVTGSTQALTYTGVTALTLGVIAGITALSSGLIVLIATLFLALLPTVLIGLITLMLRKALIIGLMIIAPLALLAWILPGTQKYWRTWRENFSKLLIMFPMIMAMLALGRVFSYITASSIDGVNDSSFLQYLIIMVGYFAPFWYLPKTFKWGGSMLSGAAKMVDSSRKVFEPAKKYVSNQGQTNKKLRQTERNRILSENPNAGGFGGLYRRTMAGGYNPLLNKRDRKEMFANNVASGKDAAQKSVEPAKLAAGYYNLPESERIKVEKLWAQGKEALGISTAGDTAAQQAALETLLSTKKWKDLREVAAMPGMQGSTMWTSFRSKNFGSIYEGAPDLANPDFKFEEANPDQITSFNPDTIEAMERYHDNLLQTDPRKAELLRENLKRALGSQGSARLDIGRIQQLATLAVDVEFIADPDGRGTPRVVLPELGKLTTPLARAPMMDEARARVTAQMGRGDSLAPVVISAVSERAVNVDGRFDQQDSDEYKKVLEEVRTTQHNGAPTQLYAQTRASVLAAHDRKILRLDTQERTAVNPAEKTRFQSELASARQEKSQAQQMWIP